MLWTREINSAIILHVKTLMEDVVDFYGTPLKVNTLLRLPHKEIVQENYPCVSVYNIGYKEDLSFCDHNSYDVVQLENNFLEKRAKASNFSFSYQIDVWCKSPIERDAITHKWVTSNPKHSILEIIDTEGNIHPCKFTQQPPQIMDSYNDSGEVVFRTMFNCEVLVGVETTRPNKYIKVNEVVYNKK